MYVRSSVVIHILSHTWFSIEVSKNGYTDPLLESVDMFILNDLSHALIILGLVLGSFGRTPV